jgi:AraC-like DNA-binding protein
MVRATIGLGVVRALVGLASARGVPRGEVLSLVAVPAVTLDDPDARMPFEDFAAAWERLSLRLDDQALSFALAETLRVEDYGLMGLACMTAGSATEALGRVVRYHRLFTDGGELRLEARRLVWHRQGGTSLGHRLVDESVIACAAAHFAQVTGAPFRPARVSFRHARPVTAARAEAFFGCGVDYDAPTNVLAIPEEALARVPRLANAALSSLVERQAEERLRTASDPSLAARVREIVARRLDQDPAAGAVAKELGVSERTLRRRLNDEQTSFRDIVDAVRRERAGELFAGGCSVVDVAFALGFSEASALARATRRWFAASPSELRARRG